MSRSELKARQENFDDSASPDVIEQTQGRWKECVRFYFRPRTPTFYHIEGFRPKHSQQFAVMCPVPVYLLFDLPGIICRVDSSFSDGNLASSSVQVYSSAQEFERLPFEQIYHDSWLDEHQKSTIIFRRNAEVIVPKQIDLEHLKRIWCRSKAEYDTLHHLLGDSLWQRWKDKITERTDHSLFLRYWVSVNAVDLSSSHIIFEFYCGKPENAGPFDIRLEIKEIESGEIYTWNQVSWTLDLKSTKKLIFNLKNLKHPDNYIVTFYIDDNLAYENEYVYEPGDIPF